MARERQTDDTLEDNVNKFQDQVQETVERLREKAEDVREQIEEATDSVMSGGEEGWKSALKFTQQHPAQAMGLAMLAGAVFGVLLLSQRRR